jgi:hypothetical protein
MERIGSMKRKSLFSPVLVFTLVVGAMVAQAQQGVVVRIPFAFTVASNELPAGKYRIRPNGNSGGLTIRNVDTNEGVNVPALTRISSRDEKTPQLVFDKAADKNYLAEVYIPGMDGYHLQGAPGKHSHTKVGGE